MEKLEKMHEELNTMFAEFNKNHMKAASGNKSATRRARVLSVQIAKAFKEYRTTSHEVF